MEAIPHEYLTRVLDLKTLRKGGLEGGDKGKMIIIVLPPLYPENVGLFLIYLYFNDGFEDAVMGMLGKARHPPFGLQGLLHHP